MWNSLYVVDDGGHFAGTYDKFYFVFFGEYVLFCSVLVFVKMMVGSQDFFMGPGLRILCFMGLFLVGSFICYEVIFLGSVVLRDDRSVWLFNVINDVWFGNSLGPY